MHPSVTPLARILRLNTELVLNCVVGLDDSAGARRATEGTNSIAFMVAHLTDSRHFIASLLDAPLPNPFAAALAGARSEAEVAALPALSALTEGWERVSAHLAVQIERLDTPTLARAATERYPGGDGTLLGALTFLVQHDTYHLGQLALLRRQLGYPPMSYAHPPREPGRTGA
jgi:uncharacterized damage-inducible protein DinB